MSDITSAGYETADFSDYCEREGGCPAVGYQALAVCIPVEVIPFVKTGPVKTICCGEPKIKRGDKDCHGKKNGTCSFTINQKLCVEVPVLIGAKTHVGDTYVDCLCASSEAALSVIEDSHEHYED